MSPHLCSLSALALHQLFITGQSSAEEITRAFLQRSENCDQAIGAFTALLTKKSLEQARELDRKKESGQTCGRLAGVPIAIKDSIHINDCTTTCGSRALESYRAPFDASAVAHLRREDAIFIGKTNLDAFGMGSSTEHSDLKITRNPWDTARTPGGSSGGSAAAVAARFSPLALGSDTGGSIRQPASYCGLFGLKPSYGRVSRFGLVAFASSLEQIGPIARNMGDLQLLFEVISQNCHRDATYVPRAEKSDGFAPASLKGCRIGHCPSLTNQAPGATGDHFRENLAKCRQEGAEIIEIDLRDLRHALATYYIISCAEASANLARFDGVRYGYRCKEAATAEQSSARSRSQSFNDEVKRRILLGTFVLSAGFERGFYEKAQSARAHITVSVSRAFESCDLIATPTTPGPAFELGALQDPLQMYLLDALTVWCNLAAVPALSIPSGISCEGLPLGLQLIAPCQRDETLMLWGSLVSKALIPEGLEKMMPAL